MPPPIPMDARPPSTAIQETPNKPDAHHGFKLFKVEEDFTKLRNLVGEIQKALRKEVYAGAKHAAVADDDASAAEAKKAAAEEKNYKRAVEMLVTDIDYIKDNLESLENSSVNVKRADVLLQFLMDASEKRIADDFKMGTPNQIKLFQIIAKLKLWVPPKPLEDDESKSKAAAKQEESPFVSSKEKDNPARQIVTGLFGLRCNQWGMDGLLNSYAQLTDPLKLCLLCFSAFECEVEKITEPPKGKEADKEVTENEYMICKSLKIKKNILIHWWVAEGLVDLHRNSNPNLTPITPPTPLSDPLSSNSVPIPTPNNNQDGASHSNSMKIHKSIAPAPSTPNLKPIPETPSSNSDPPPIPLISNSTPIPTPDEASNSNSATVLNSNKSPQQAAETVEETGEKILKELMEKGFIDPVMKAGKESSRVVMHPFVHSFVTALANRAGFFDFSSNDGKLTPSFGLSQRACLVKSPENSSCKVWEKYTEDRNKLKRFETVQTLFNVNEPIIDIKPEWFSKMTNLSILHLGSWRSEAVEHIEVEDTKFMDDLKTMVKMRLFSLQGVSTIMKLSDSVCKLENLLILDLRECHNLEDLPVDIGCLKSLTHLDITNCHLLTKLPKGISLLSKLQVLKGFVIYDQAGEQDRGNLCRWSKKARRCVVHDVMRFKIKEECTLKDLQKLEELRQLSIVVNVDAFPAEEEVQVLREMRNLRKLKISWEKSFKKADATADTKAQSGKCRWCFRSKIQDDANKSGGKNEDGASQSAGEKEDGASQSAGKKEDAEKKQDGANQVAPKAVSDEQEPSCCLLNLKCCSNSRVELKKNERLDQIEKLELWCFPKTEAPNWVKPDQLEKLEKLYIKGGELERLPGHVHLCDTDKENIKWPSIKMLRLKYLPNLEITWPEFKDMFPNLEYLEKLECGFGKDGKGDKEGKEDKDVKKEAKLPYFPCDQEGVWQNW